MENTQYRKVEGKERVLSAIRHEETDRVPVDYMAVPEVTKALCDYLNLSTEEELLKRFEVDSRFFRPKYVRPPSMELKDGLTKDATGNIYKTTRDATGKEYSTIVHPALSEANSVHDIVNYPDFPDPDWYNYFISEQDYEKVKNFALVAYDMGINFLHACQIRGMENLMMDMAMRPQMAEALFTRYSEFNLERCRRFLEANPGRFDIIGIGDDIAGQDGLMLSPDMWRKFQSPHRQKLVDLAEKYGVIPYFHGCGGFSVLFADFIEMGIKIVGRLQSHAKGNDPARLKKEFGEKLCFWGGIDAQRTLISENVNGVRTHVEKILKLLNSNGGFVLCPTHTFTTDVPLENIIEVYKTALNLF